MTAAAARKLQKDVDIVLKKVEDGLDEFQSVWDLATTCASGTQKDKYGEELKRSINKLQRLRAQIREWLGQGEIKNVSKDKLEESRKRIEEDMQRFKDFERDLKTKAFSTSALAKETELDLEEVEKIQYQEWLNSTIQVLNDQQDEFDADLEALGNKKSLGIAEKSQQTSLRSLQERHRWHTHKLELVLRALNNDSIDLSEIAILRESVDVFIDMHQDPDYVHDEGLYDCFDLAEFEEKTPVIRNSGASEVATKEGNTDSSKEEPPKKGKEKEKQKKNDKKDKKREEREKKAQGTAGAAGTPGGTPAGGISSKSGSNAGSRQGGDGKSTPSGAGPGSPPSVSAKADPKQEKKLLDDFNLDEVKVQEDQLLSEAEEFICKICQIHVVGCSPKLTNCSHLFCGDCIAQWFAQHPESQTWAQRAKSAGPERVVPCPVCKQPLNEKKDLYPVCGATSRSENLLLWRMLSSLKIMCVNHSKLRPDGKCEWIGEYGQYQKHALSCRNCEGGDNTPAAVTTPQPPRKLDAGDVDAPSEKSVGVGVAAAVAHAAAHAAAAAPTAAPTPPRTPPATVSAAAVVSEQRSPGGGSGVRPPVVVPAAPVLVPAPKASPTSPEASSTAGQAPGKTTRPVAEQPPKSGLSPQGATPASAPSLPAAPPAAAPTLPQSPGGMAPKPQGRPHAAPVVAAPVVAAPLVAPAPASAAPQPTETKAASPESDSSFIVQATCTFEPTASSMLHIQVGDFVQVLERHASGWSYCRSMANNSSGWAPNWAVTPTQSDEAAPKAPEAAPKAPEAAPKAAPAPEAAPKEQVLRLAPLSPAPVAAPAAMPAAVAAPAPAQRPRPAAPQAAPQSPAAPKAPKSVVRAASATFSAVGPAQLSVAVNDLVEIIERHGSGWTYGRKVGGADATTPEGWFPDWVCGTK